MNMSDKKLQNNIKNIKILQRNFTKSYNMGNNYKNNCNCYFFMLPLKQKEFFLKLKISSEFISQ